MSTRNVYQIVQYSADWSAEDQGLYGTVTRARAAVKREGFTRRHRVKEDTPISREFYIRPDAELDQFQNTDEFCTIVPRRVH
jgi:hypothetical protein